jgi:ABC-type amino acid transport system permease subunit
MKGLFYVIALVLSLPNLLAGVALLVIKHTFSTRDPLQIITDFLFEIVWGLPLAGFLFLVLLVLGFFARTRAHAAMFAFILNAAALGLVLFRVGLPSDFYEAVLFVPIFLALIGFAWIAYRVFAPEPTIGPR